MEQIEKSNHKYDIVFVGHFALDTIVSNEMGSISHSLGGGVTYGSLASSIFDPNLKIGIVSKIGMDFDKKYLSMFSPYQIDCNGILNNSKKTTKYMLRYHEKTRDLRLISKADNILIKDFPEKFCNTKALHLTPIANEFSEEFFTNLLNKKEFESTIIGMDIQGLIRRFDEEGNIFYKKDDEMRDYVLAILKKFGKRMFFKASDEEALGVSQTTDIIQATNLLGETGAYILTTLGKDGLLFKAPGYPLLHLNAYTPRYSIDETGAGDCFMAVLLAQLIHNNNLSWTYEELVQMIKVASGASSFLIEKKGPNGFKAKSEILERVEKGFTEASNLNL